MSQALQCFVLRCSSVPVKCSHLSGWIQGLGQPLLLQSVLREGFFHAEQLVLFVGPQRSV